MTFNSAPRRSRSGPKIASFSSWSRLFDLLKLMKNSRVLNSSSTMRRNVPPRPVTKLTAAAGTSMMSRSSCSSESSNITGPRRCFMTIFTYLSARSRCSLVPAISNFVFFSSKKAPLTAAILFFVRPLGPLRKAASSSEIVKKSLEMPGPDGRSRSTSFPAQSARLPLRPPSRPVSRPSRPPSRPSRWFPPFPFPESALPERPLPFRPEEYPWSCDGSSIFWEIRSYTSDSAKRRSSGRPKMRSSF
mmetsp:Transcript_70950/g.123019  ORF Transcript_70950/g.123019 Transcript_70950/m.123019 type:complete len:246 (-) Transcript_70950:1136-1873(-)